MWINSITGEIYGGDLRFGTADFVAPSAPPPGVTHAVLDENGAFVAWKAAVEALNSPEDWDGFRQWRRQNEDYVALTRAEGGLVLAMEADIARGDYTSVAAGWERLKDLGAVSPTLEEALMTAIQTYNLTSLAQALEDYINS